MPLIGLVGYAGSGKDSIAKALKWKQVAFADAIKDDVSKIVPDAHRMPKEVMRPLWLAHGAAMRSIDPEHWIKLLKIDERPCVVTDVRRLPELKWLLSQGGTGFRIDRPGVGPYDDEEREWISEIDRSGLCVHILNHTPEQAAAAIIAKLSGTDDDMGVYDDGSSISAVPVGITIPTR